MTPESLLERLANLNVWKRGGQRAPQKPLLLLIALARARRGESRLQPFTETAEKLTELLKRFGPPRQNYEPKHPFLRLVNDGLWEVPNLPQMSSKEIDEMRRDELRNLKGGLPEDIYNALRGDHDLLRRAAEFLLENEFPRSYHRELLEAVGFDDLDAPYQVADAAISRQRDREFRHRVITAYEHKCAVCNYDIRLDNELLGLEAAHILWHSRGGPDVVPNGLALCALHHNALDRGGISVDDDMNVLVSPQLHGCDAALVWFLEYEGKPLRSPRNIWNRPNPEYLNWHRREVFRNTPD